MSRKRVALAAPFVAQTSAVVAAFAARSSRPWLSARLQVAMAVLGPRRLQAAWIAASTNGAI